MAKNFRMKKIKYRWFYSSSGKLVLGGKNAEQNEQLLKNVKPKDIILHTKEPGSPFCVLRKPSAQDIKEAAIFCACFSKGWKKGKKEMEVHIFKGEQLLKEKNMAVGTFGVLGQVQKVKVKLQLWLGVQKGKLRAAPKSCFKKPLLKIVPGHVEKDKAAEMIQQLLEKKGYKFSKEEILQAIPAGGIACL